mmetsp:Transcript_6805/g.20685  ORF Transcript_6805/g.20685 Transcript_6805/m.20685 type:complete len:212 (-) Transcript_6805:400-1035(-)
MRALAASHMREVSASRMRKKIGFAASSRMSRTSLQLRTFCGLPRDAPIEQLHSNDLHRIALSIQARPRPHRAGQVTKRTYRERQAVAPEVQFPRANLQDQMAALNGAVSANVSTHGEVCFLRPNVPGTDRRTCQRRGGPKFIPFRGIIFFVPWLLGAVGTLLLQPTSLLAQQAFHQLVVLRHHAHRHLASNHWPAERVTCEHGHSPRTLQP